MARALVLVVLLGGCADLFNLEPVHYSPADGSDGRDSASPTCTTDPFDTIGQSWVEVLEHSAFILEIRSGTLAIDLTQAANLTTMGEAGVRTFGEYDMTGATVSVEVPQIVSSTTYFVYNYLEVRIDGDNRYTMVGANQQLVFASTIDGAYSQIDSRPYNAVAHRFWRMAQGPAPGQLRFETSADRGSWFTQAEISNAGPLERVKLGLIAGTYDNGDPNPGTAVFDNFTICDATAL